MKVKSLTCVRLFETPWTVAYQALPSMGFSRQEYWNGLERKKQESNGKVHCVLISSVLTLFSGNFGKIRRNHGRLLSQEMRFSDIYFKKVSSLGVMWRSDFQGEAWSQ